MLAARGDSFAAKRARKLVHRRAVDYTSAVVRYLQVSLVYKNLPYAIVQCPGIDKCTTCWNYTTLAFYCSIFFFLKKKHISDIAVGYFFLMLQLYSDFQEHNFYSQLGILIKFVLDMTHSGRR